MSDTVTQPTAKPTRKVASGFVAAAVAYVVSVVAGFPFSDEVHAAIEVLVYAAAAWAVKESGVEADVPTSHEVNPYA